MKEKEQLKFSYNWNNKLDCQCFSTLRRSDRYNVGDVVEVIRPNNGGVFCAVVRTKHLYPMEKLNDTVCYLDTGYDRATTLGILQKMYPNQIIKEIYHYVLERLPSKNETATQKELF